MPTISGRAWAADGIAITAPMVTANAAAILNDIALSIPHCPVEGQSCRRTLKEAVHGLTHALLTASFNRTVSTPTRRHAFDGRNKGNVRIKVNDLETTLAPKKTQCGHGCVRCLETLMKKRASDDAGALISK